VRSASVAGVARSEGHLYHVQKAVGDFLPCLMDTLMAAWLLVVPTIKLTFVTG